MFWDDPGEPVEPRYLALLRAARHAIRAADRQGKVVMAGLFGFAWLTLDDLYRNRARGLFDAVAVNMFTRLPRDEVNALERVRAVMNHNGDRRVPLLLTEFSWPTAKGRYPGYAVSREQAARNLRSTLGLAARARRRLNLRHVFYFTWLTADTGTHLFDYAGVRTVDLATMHVTAKPGQAAYRDAARRLEGCSKTRRADICG